MARMRIYTAAIVCLMLGVAIFAVTACTSTGQQDIATIQTATTQAQAEIPLLQSTLAQTAANAKAQEAAATQAAAASTDPATIAADTKAAAAYDNLANLTTKMSNTLATTNTVLTGVQSTLASVNQPGANVFTVGAAGANAVASSPLLPAPIGIYVGIAGAILGAIGTLWQSSQKNTAIANAASATQAGMQVISGVQAALSNGSMTVSPAAVTTIDASNTTDHPINVAMAAAIQTHVDNSTPAVAAPAVKVAA